MNIFELLKNIIDIINKKSFSIYMILISVLLLYFLLNEYLNYDIILENSKDNNLYFGFSEPANPSLYGIIELHNFIMFFIVMIVFFTLITIGEILSTFSVQHLRGVASYNKAKSIYNINIQHNTRLELFWTAIPFMILFAIAIPSFAFLYAGEIPRDCSLSLKVIAHQWFWSYELTVHLRDTIKPLYLYETIKNIDPIEYRLYLDNNTTEIKTVDVVSDMNLKENLRVNFIKFMSNINITNVISNTNKMDLMTLVNSISDQPLYCNTKNYLNTILRTLVGSNTKFDIFENIENNVKTLNYANYLDKLASMELLNTKLDCKENLFFNKYCNNIERDCSISFDSYMLPVEDIKDSDRLLKTTNPVVLPVGTYVKVLITSDDVIHSWALKDLGLKLDAAPGRTNQVTLIIDKLGRYTGQCSELCGAQHGFMPIEIFCVDRITFISYFMNESEDFFHIFYKTNFLYYLFELEKQIYSLNQIILPDRAIQLFNKEMLSKKSFEYIAKNSWGSLNDNFSDEKLSYIKNLDLNLKNEFKLIKDSLKNKYLN